MPTDEELLFEPFKKLKEKSKFYLTNLDFFINGYREAERDLKDIKCDNVLCDDLADLHLCWKCQQDLMTNEEQNMKKKIKQLKDSVSKLNLSNNQVNEVLDTVKELFGDD